MELVSVFTPSHDTRFLQDAYYSLLAQTDPNWEWVILLNGPAREWNPNPPDLRIKQFVSYNSSGFVGALKAEACAKCSGEILIELDHDDMLFDHAIAEIRKAFEEDPEVGFVYSNTVHATADWKPTQRFSPVFGWRYRKVQFKGHTLDEHISFPPTPNVVSRIWFAPNHVRAFRRDVYEKAGGYNTQMRILDDLDFMCRAFLLAKFQICDKPLYLYRVHGKNTWLEPNINSEIQNNVYRIHDQYIERLALKWARDNGLRCLDLGGRINKAPGYESVDLKDADVIADLNQPWPFEDGSVGVVRAYDIFEHLTDSIHTMKELWRVLVRGGYAFISVPSTDGRGAFQDPTHTSYWNENSMLYYTNRRWGAYIDCPVRFQAMRLYTTAPDAQKVCWVNAHLLKLDGSREDVPGEVLI